MIMKRIFSLFPRKKWWKQTRVARVLLIYFYVCIVGPFLVLHPLVLLLHLKSFLARVVMETQHVEITGLVAWWENVTALACLYRIPLAMTVFFFLHSLSFVQLIPSLSLVSLQVFPLIHPPFFGFPLFILFFCVVTGIVFVCFPFVSVLFLTLLFCFRRKCLSFCGSFVCENCVSFSPKNYAALLLESRSANANAEWKIISVYTASVPVILCIAIHYWKKLNLIGPDWVPWWFRQPLRDAIYSCVDQ